MAKKSKKLKVNGGSFSRPISYADTSRDGTKKGQLLKVGKELRIDKLLDKKKEIKEKDVFNFSEKQIQVK